MKKRVAAKSGEFLNDPNSAALDVFFSLRTEFLFLDMISRRHKGVKNTKSYQWRERRVVTLPLLKKWLDVEQNIRLGILDEYVIKDRPRPKKLPSKLTMKSVSDIWERGHEFFSIESLSSIEGLTSARRKAALKIHPDVGGSNEDMAKLNSTYDLLYEMFAAKAPGGIAFEGNNEDAGQWNPISWKPRVSSIKENGDNAYPFSDPTQLEMNRLYNVPLIRDEMIAATYFDFLVDDWNLDEAIQFFNDGRRFPNLLSEKHIIFIEGSVCRYGFFDAIYTLIKRCSRIDRFELCQSLAPTLKRLLELHTQTYDAFFDEAYWIKETKRRAEHWFSLGQSYYTGRFPWGKESPDYEQAAELFRMAANAGSAEAKEKMAVMARNGTLPKDDLAFDLDEKPKDENRNRNESLKQSIDEFAEGLDKQRGRKFPKDGHLVHPRQRINVLRLTDGKLGGEETAKLPPARKRIKSTD